MPLFQVEIFIPNYLFLLIPQVMCWMAFGWQLDIEVEQTEWVLVNQTAVWRILQKIHLEWIM